MKPPQLSNTLIISDSAIQAAEVSCVLAQRGTYLPIIDGPRLSRPDFLGEVVRRNNAAARMKASRVIFAGLGTEAISSFQNYFRNVQTERVDTSKQAIGLLPEENRKAPQTFKWGKDDIGIGLLNALRSNSTIQICDIASPIKTIPSISGHLVVCEKGEAISEVIAANYAFALGAGLCMVPEISAKYCKDILERFYSVNESSKESLSQTRRLGNLRDEIRELCNNIQVPVAGSITFITRKLPLGYGFPEVPTTHLFSYPDLGINVLNGFAAEQRNARGTNIVSLVDPEKAEAPEIDLAAKILAKRGAFVRSYKGASATVKSVSDMVELFPYDLLIFATHCGDAPGYRWTYKFEDSSKKVRTLVVDIALGIAATDDIDMLNVTQYMRFHELDGVDWSHPNRSDFLEVGTAIEDFVGQFKELEPINKETIPRVLGSSALQMYDNNFITLPRSIAYNGSPIIVNNACGSWHSLAERFVYGNARAYVGTLFPITTSESHDVVAGILSKHHEKNLPHAIWSTQNAVYEDSPRRPYIVTGVYPQNLRITKEDVPARIVRLLREGFFNSQKTLKQGIADGDEFAVKIAENTSKYFYREAAAFENRWGKLL